MTAVKIKKDGCRRDGGEEIGDSNSHPTVMYWYVNVLLSYRDCLDQTTHHEHGERKEGQEEKGEKQSPK